jgi:septal ring factor EnvC (AmiA/AmiB activator)
MIRKFIRWFISPSQKPIIEDIDVYSKLVELEEKYNCLLHDVKRLEEENIETTNNLYELQNSIEAVDTRIDILSVEAFTKNV